MRQYVADIHDLPAVLDYRHEPVPIAAGTSKLPSRP
jgi:hypothetical protein